MKIVIKISFHPFLFTPYPAFPHGGRSLTTFPPWGKMKGGTNNVRKNKIISSVNLFVTKK